MRSASRTVNGIDQLDADARGGASLAPAVTRAAATLDALAEDPSNPRPLSDLARRRPDDGPYGVSVTLLKARADDARREALVADLQRLARQFSNPLIAHRGDDGHRP